MYRLARPLLFALDAETAHHLTIRAGRALGQSSLARALLARLCVVDDPRLAVDCLGLSFRGPVGLAAGFDKNAVLLDVLPSVGFGFLEVGTVTPRPWGGNPRPRLFRLPVDEAVVNRMGLNNDGAQAVAARLSARSRTVPVGANVGRVNDGVSSDPAEDFAAALAAVAPHADYAVLNVSCPNLAGAHRSFEDPAALAALLRAVPSPPVPLLVKLSPDVAFERLLELVDVGLEAGVSGFVLTNTTTTRLGLRTMPSRIQAVGAGGLSGRPLTVRSLAAVRAVYRHVRGRVPIIGVGGISTAQDAYDRIRAGATLVQLYTALVYEGPTLPARIHGGLLKRLTRDGLRSIQDAVGVDA